MSRAAAARRAASACGHCGQPVAGDAPFCCAGCAAVHQLLTTCDLARYYELRRGPGLPVPDLRDERRDLKWLDPIDAARAAGPAAERVQLDVQGLHCTGCVWLIQELFRRQPGGLAIELNPARGQLELLIAPGFALRGFVAEVERFGYLFGPPLKRARRASDALLTRAAIAIALAGNGMMLALALYLGLDHGPVFRWFGAVGYLLACAAVAVGAPVFVRSAWRGLRAGILHLDLPISLGIALAFAGTTWGFVAGDPRAAYGDTLAVFIALMLVGRWLQERVLEGNRDRLLASDGAEGLLTRRLDAGQVAIVACGEVEAGDTLLIAPGDLVPVEVELGPAGATLSLDWIRGEAEPQAFAGGARAPAGAFNAGREALLVRATEGFELGRIARLLGGPIAVASGGPQASGLARRISGLYVVGVLVAAAAGFGGWLLATGDLGRALAVATSVLVITCPCAFGIAAPLAHELVLGGLRRLGLFVRSPGFLDRALAVRQVVFDKTGTLTTGRLELGDPAIVDQLAAGDRAALYDLVARSSHPASQAIRRALEARGAVLRPEVIVVETAGAGLSARIDGHAYRLGARGFAEVGATGAAPGFSRDGVLLAELALIDPLRPAAAADLAELGRLGCTVWLLSGDAPARVGAAAAAVGLPAARALAGQSPEAKAAWLAAHDHGDTLFVGDGVNDSLAARQAFASGTPAIDRPFMAALTDFYFVTPGLGPIAAALRATRALQRVLRRNLAIAIAYNVGGVALCWAGLMRPWLAAVLMPLSSLVVVLATVRDLSPRAPLWRPVWRS